jgi:hypothetical protein
MFYVFEHGARSISQIDINRKHDNRNKSVPRFSMQTTEYFQSPQMQPQFPDSTQTDMQVVEMQTKGSLPSPDVCAPQTHENPDACEANAKRITFRLRRISRNIGIGVLFCIVLALTGAYLLYLDSSVTIYRKDYLQTLQYCCTPEMITVSDHPVKCQQARHALEYTWLTLAGREFMLNLGVIYQNLTTWLGALSFMIILGLVSAVYKLWDFCLVSGVANMQFVALKTSSYLGKHKSLFTKPTQKDVTV